MNQAWKEQGFVYRVLGKMYLVQSLLLDLLPGPKQNKINTDKYSWIYRANTDKQCLFSHNLGNTGFAHCPGCLIPFPHLLLPPCIFSDCPRYHHLSKKTT